jgi:hypothetical protein
LILRHSSIAETDRSPIGLWEMLCGRGGSGREGESRRDRLEDRQGVVLLSQHQRQLRHPIIAEMIVAETEQGEGR